ncbi:IS30 family transposase [Saccharopolyspora sp. NPDC050389]|uniref:IS30 family transposase n=1 Tax=Saccharopolyspora sp. NPDC050389 TaxID=3155516 RepID=UPI0033C3E9AA
MGRPALPLQVQRQFWSMMRTGVVLDDAAAVVGVSKTVAWRWFREAGGVIPITAPADRAEAQYSRLSFAEREEISCRRAAGAGIRAIARALGRSPSTVSRELARGTVRRKTGYRASVAQARADVRSRRPKVSRLAQNDRLREHVQQQLRDKLSPEQVSQRLIVDYPDEPEMRVSHETIYRALYVPGRGALQRGLVRCMRTGRTLRKPRRKVAERRGRIADMVNISERPAEVEDRKVAGHWEGDLIAGPQHHSAIGTLVERATGYVILLHLPDGHGAVEVQQAIIAAMNSLPRSLRRSLTWDQGREMTNHVQIAAATGMDIFFCDAHSPWQRGTNENTNGLLRQYFPKGTDLSGYHRDYLEFVAAQLNRRPRKRLGWKTPTEALDALLSPSDPPGVALIA